MAASRTDVDRDAPHRHLLDDVQFHPVFVMGDHRTGTTILYKILGLQQCFNIVTVYHIVKFRELLHHHVHRSVAEARRELAGRLERSGLKDRGYDGIAVDCDTPEEYGFILHDGGYRPQLRPSNVDDLVCLGKKIQVSGDPGRPLLLKNPWDYFENFLYVKQAFPDSKFIFIHRHPLETINSQLRIIRGLLAARNEYVALVASWYASLFEEPIKLRMARFLFSAHLDLGLRMVTRHVARGARYFVDHVASLPPSDHLSIRYEDLCQDAGGTIGRILDWLGLGRGAGIQDARAVNPRAIPLLPEVHRHRRAIFAKVDAYAELWGYRMEDVLKE